MDLTDALCRFPRLWCKLLPYINKKGGYNCQLTFSLLKVQLVCRCLARLATAIDIWNRHQEGNILVYWRNWGTPYFKSWSLSWFLLLCRAYTLHPVHDSVWYLHHPHTHFWGCPLCPVWQFASLPFFFFFNQMSSLPCLLPSQFL